MEIAAAAIGVLLSSTLPDILSMIRKERKKPEPGVQEIQVQLEVIQVKIKQYRRRGKDTSPLQRDCIAQLRRLADDIQDRMDCFRVGKTTSRKFAREIDQLKIRLEAALKQLDVLNDLEISTGEEEVAPSAAGRLVGMKDAEGQLVALLQSQSEEGKLKVISVVGFSGPAMTHLAKQVYESEVGRQFSRRACVSATGKDPGALLTEILQQVQNGDTTRRAIPGGASISDVEKLRSCLSKNRYLIVIDDVKTEELCDIISAAFSCGDGVNGIIIVMTATELPAATRCRCGNGLPPALDSTAQVLIRELGKGGFEDACRTLRDDTLATLQRRGEEILSGLVNLNCLLYFCMFPRDHPVRRNPLIRRWLAEGLIQPENKAIQTLETLIKCNTIINSIEKSNSGKVKRCQPPGMMLDCICDKSMSENFITMLCGRTHQPEYVRRLSVHPKRASAQGRLDLKFLPDDLPHLHTLAVFPPENLSKHEASLEFAKYELLRVLDLKECANLNERRLKKIFKLLLMKYLSLGDSIGEVPREIARLKWLETLEMRRTQVVEVPIEVIELPRLKHLLGKFQLFKGDLTDKKLEELPSRRSALETLSGFVTCSRKGFTQLMIHMERLRKVKIWCDSTADEANLKTLSEAINGFISRSVDMLRADYSLCIDFQECSTECSQPFLDSLRAKGKLTSLKLHGKLTRFPQFDNIEELCLSSTDLSGDDILAALGALNLKYLKLIEENLGPLVIGEKHFRSLERICLVGVRSLHDITIHDRALRCLISLHILCPDLGDLPGVQIGSLGRLKEVGLHSGVAQGIKDGWQEAARGHPNCPNVLFIRR